MINISEDRVVEYLNAKEHFLLFRDFHKLGNPGQAANDTLVGDYHFSQFSLCLIPIDSVELTDRFAAILRKDACGYDCDELSPMVDKNPKDVPEAKAVLEKELERICHSDNKQMEEDLKRVILSGGKRLRPFLSWTAYNLGGDKTYPILPLMVMVELMHSASIIHDDVVDKGMKRRGIDTINALRGDYSAVQSADFILGRAMELLKVYKGSGINERLAEVSENMCLGELRQMGSHHCKITEEVYLEIIENKTALFISAAAACGGIAAGLESIDIKCLERYGYNIGMAFQIKDDILDITGGKSFGKVINQDAKEGICTLPQIIGVEAAQKKVEEYSGDAIRALAPIDDSKAKQDLKKMALLLSKREY